MAKYQTVLGLLLTFGLNGCLVGPDFKRPEAPDAPYLDIPLPAQTVSSHGIGGASQRLLPNQAIPEQWWTLFGSPELNELIAQGLANNPTMKAAQAALQQARCNYYAQIGATLLPAFNAGFLAERQRFSTIEFGDPNLPVTTFNLFNAQVNVNYMLDIFGGSRREIEALRAQVDYQQFELEATYLTLVANIVTTALTEASLRAQIQATQALIGSQAKELKIVNGQFELGGASRSDVLTQQTLLAQTKATLPPLEKNLAINRHLLSVLVGELPSEQLLPTFHIEKMQLPTEIPLSLPSLLVRKRPDVRAAEALLHQACAQIGVATANMLPQFNINGYYAWDSESLNNLFSPANVIWNIASQTTQPLFQGGALFMRRKAAIAAFEQARAQYQHVVLQAFQNVADTLRALEMDAQALQAQAAAENAAWKALVLTQKQYKLGGIPYINLLNAEHQYQQALINRIQAQGVRYTDTAALFQALGGAWWNCDTQST